MAAIEYTDTEYQSLLKQFQILRTYEAVADWDKSAQAEVDRIERTATELQAAIVLQEQEVEAARERWKKKNLLLRIFGVNREEFALRQTLRQWQEFLTRLQEMAENLMNKIDFSPNSPEDQKTLLKELKLHKKELQASKKEVSASMRDIRTQTRQSAANAGRGPLGSYNSRAASFERRQIRYSREAALAPHENEKAAIERQLVETDRKILWVERFKN